MKPQTRLLALLLCLLTLLGCMAACKQEPADGNQGANGSDDEVTTGVNEQGEPVDENGYVLDGIPADTDFGGREFSILHWTEATYRLFPAEASENDPVSNEIYLRNFDLEERLNLEFKLDSEQGGWAHQSAFISRAQMSGDMGYELIISYALWPGRSLAPSGMLYNLNECTYPEFEKPWWPDSLSEYEYYGKLYYTTCNASIGSILSAEITFANQQLIADYCSDMPDPLELVIENKWTLEEFYKYTKMFSGVASVEDEASRIYGVVVDDWSRTDAFYYGAGQRSVVKNENGKGELAYIKKTQVDTITSLVDTMVRILDTDEAKIESNSAQLMFDRRTAFMVACMDRITYTENDNPYAALPMPMMDLDQDGYRTMLANGYEMLCIPVTAPNPEESGIVIEAMSSSDYRDIFPFFYESKLKLRYSNSTVGAEAYDMIRDSIVMDFGRAAMEKGPENAWRECLKPSGVQNVFVSEMESLNGNRQLETALAKLLATFR